MRSSLLSQRGLQQQFSASAAVSRHRSHRKRLLVIQAADKEDRPSREDRSNPNKADFSAYWSLKFKEFFSKRRQYLELARKRQEPPEYVKKLEAQIQQQEDRLEQARIASQQLRTLQIENDPKLQQQAIQQDQQVLDDFIRARAQVHDPRVKLMQLTAYQLRQAAKALLLMPFTLPALLSARWQAMFASKSYENFLMSEGERVWGFRNRMENERWFWEVFALDRLLVPVAWAICYQLVVPNNLIWSVLVPISFISWQEGRLPGPADLEWWIIMILGLYGKCWDQVLAILAFFFRWW